MPETTRRRIIDKVRKLRIQQELTTYSLSQVFKLCRQELFKVGEEAGLPGNGYVGDVCIIKFDQIVDWMERNPKSAWSYMVPVGDRNFRRKGVAGIIERHFARRMPPATLH
jgi:hypothetical protein